VKARDASALVQKLRALVRVRSVGLAKGRTISLGMSVASVAADVVVDLYSLGFPDALSLL
jgi:hypothetical protein